MFFKIGSIKNSAIFTGKHLCWGLFLIKLQTPTQTPTEVFPVDIAKFLRIVFLYNTSGGCFWQSYHGTVKSAGVPALWFRASMCFQFWSKTFTKRCTNNFYYYVSEKTIFSLLGLIDHVLWISEYILEKHWLLSILIKKLTQSVAEVSMQYHVSNDFLPLNFEVDQVLSILGYDLDNGRMPCKEKHCIKNMTVKIPILILFRFCLFFVADFYFASCLCCSCKLI